MGKRVQIFRILSEGNSIRATVRLTGAAKNTITNLLVTLGTGCLNYQNAVFRDLPCKRLQCDEIWSFVYSKEKNVPEAQISNTKIGDIWTWVAICADSRLVPCWLVGKRTSEFAHAFMADLASRLRSRVQLTTDGYKPYPDAVFEAFGEEVDFATLVKKIGAIVGKDGKIGNQIIGSERLPRIGSPDLKHVSTSYVERQNGTMRQEIRRFYRKTKGFSKKFENHCHSQALFYMYYNFARRHQTLRTTPAVAAGIADHIWSLEELISVAESKFLRIRH